MSRAGQLATAPRIISRLAGDGRVATMSTAREAQALPYFRAASSVMGGDARVEGQSRVMLASANYLGLAGHPAVLAAAHDALDRYGSSTTGSRLLNGTVTLHEQLELELADWMGTEDALVFTTGYQANVGVLSALLAAGDTAVVDSADHASLLDGCALSGAKARSFRHNRLDLLGDALERAGRTDSAAMVIVDGVYSMHGDVPPLNDIARSCAERNAALMVDEAHAIGVLGPTGAGVTELFGLDDRVHVRMGALSKALGSVGGFIAGSAQLIDFLRFHARSFVFSTASTPASLAAALAAIRIRRSAEGEALAEQVLAVALRLRHELRDIGFVVLGAGTGPDGADLVTPIVPVVAVEDERAMAWWKHLYDDGVFTAAAVQPAVPRSGALLRLCVTALHDDTHVERILKAFSSLRKREQR